jgi:hypothetical protein
VSGSVIRVPTYRRVPKPDRFIMLMWMDPRLPWLQETLANPLACAAMKCIMMWLNA